MSILPIILGALVGFLVGAALAARYLRREIAANIGQRLRHIEQQLESLRAEVNLDAATRLAELGRRLGTNAPVSQGPPGPDFEDEDDDDN